MARLFLPTPKLTSQMLGKQIWHQQLVHILSCTNVLQHILQHTSDIQVGIHIPKPTAAPYVRVHVPPCGRPDYSSAQQQFKLVGFRL